MKIHHDIHEIATARLLVTILAIIDDQQAHMSKSAQFDTDTATLIVRTRRASRVPQTLVASRTVRLNCIGSIIVYGTCQ